MTLPENQQVFESMCKAEDKGPIDFGWVCLWIELSSKPRKEAHTIEQYKYEQRRGTMLFSHATTYKGFMKMINYYLNHCL